VIRRNSGIANGTAQRPVNRLALKLGHGGAVAGEEGAPRELAPVKAPALLEQETLVKRTTIAVHYIVMGFRETRQRLIAALEDGRFQHEIRGAVEEKNLLAIGDVSAREVIAMLRRCRGNQHRSSPHARDRNVTVHEFMPLVSRERWYIKAYFLEDEAWFISVHRSETGQ